MMLAFLRLQKTGCLLEPVDSPAGHRPVTPSEKSSVSVPWGAISAVRALLPSRASSIRGCKGNTPLC